MITLSQIIKWIGDVKSRYGCIDIQYGKPYGINIDLLGGTPGNDEFYSTDSDGALGWHALPTPRWSVEKIKDDGVWYYQLLSDQDCGLDEHQWYGTADAPETAPDGWQRSWQAASEVTVISQIQVDGLNIQAKTITLKVFKVGTESEWTTIHTGTECE